jgi:MOSC domain-containing protein YiiM
VQDLATASRHTLAPCGLLAHERGGFQPRALFLWYDVANIEQYVTVIEGLAVITIKSIMYKPKSEPATHSDIGYLRRPLTEASLVENYGIENDRKGGNPKRNLNVMDEITLKELGAEGYPTSAGELGENIILSGIDLRTLPVGTKLRLGDEAVIELGRHREPCEQLTPLDERMPETVIDRVGVMCRVAKSGKIKVGDPVEVLKEPVQA